MAQNIVETLLKSPFVHRFDPRFRWLLVTADPDDDKFADCAVAARAEYLVTDDRHFNALKTNPFPPVNVISADDFLQIVLALP